MLETEDAFSSLREQRDDISHLIAALVWGYGISKSEACREFTVSRTLWDRDDLELEIFGHDKFSDTLTLRAVSRNTAPVVALREAFTENGVLKVPTPETLRRAVKTVFGIEL